MQKHYNKVADIYDRQYNQRAGKVYYSHICDQVSNALPAKGCLLDLGCGTGLFLKRYTANGGRGFGLDISRGMITRARTRCPESDVALGTAEQIPFRDESFDAVASILAFSYLQHPESMLKESLRVLKPGGCISICTLGKNVFTTLVPIIYRLGETMHIQRPGMAYFGEHYYRDQEIVRLFETVGFVDVRTARCSFAHVNLGDQMFALSRRFEPFIEKNIPALAYNICISARKPEKID